MDFSRINWKQLGITPGIPLVILVALFFMPNYGWEYGVPAFGLALLTGYSRVQAKKHHWYDVAASDAIAIGVNYLVVSRYHKPYSPYEFSMGATPDSVSVQFAMNF